MDPTSRLRLATRIHFALLRQCGETVEVRDLLDGRGEGREALWVCAASGDPELAALARDLGRANRRHANDVAAAAAAAARPAAPETGTRAAGHVPQDTAWSQDTSGFGASRLPELGAQPARSAATPTPSWLAPLDWLRRGATR